MHIDERKYAYGYVQGDSDSNHVMKSKYDIYLYGIQNVNITNLSAKSQWVFNYCGDSTFVGSNDGALNYNIPYKYLTAGSVLSVTGFIIAEYGDNPMSQNYYLLPYFEYEDNPGAGIDIKSVVIHTNPGKTGSAITITVNKYTHCGLWKSDSNTHYYFYFKMESSGDQS